MTKLPLAVSLLAVLACGSSSGDGSPAPGRRRRAGRGRRPTSRPRPSGTATSPRPPSTRSRPPSSPTSIASAGAWGGCRSTSRSRCSRPTRRRRVRAFTPTEDHFRPDCDLDPVPVPPGGALEGEEGYECRGDGDCHLIVVDRPRMKLFEMWRADIRGDAFRGGCLAVWDMTRVYPPERPGRAVHERRRRRLPDRAAPLRRRRGGGGPDRPRHPLHPAERHDPRARVRPPRDARDAGDERPARRRRPTARGCGCGRTTRSPRCRTRARGRSRGPCSATACCSRTPGASRSPRGATASRGRSGRASSARLDLAALRPRDFEMIAAGDRIPLTNDCVRNP